MNNTCSTTNDLTVAIEKLKNKLRKNEYPDRLVNSKIASVLHNNFEPRHREHDNDITNFEQNRFNMCLSYTHARCEKFHVN